MHAPNARKRSKGATCADAAAARWCPCRGRRCSPGVGGGGGRLGGLLAGCAVASTTLLQSGSRRAGNRCTSPESNSGLHVDWRGPTDFCLGSAWTDVALPSLRPFSCPAPRLQRACVVFSAQNATHKSSQVKGEPPCCGWRIIHSMAVNELLTTGIIPNAMAHFRRFLP